MIRRESTLDEYRHRSSSVSVYDEQPISSTMINFFPQRRNVNDN